MKILALDPGTTETGVVLLDTATGKVEFARTVTNALVLRIAPTPMDCDLVAIEMIASYGMPVGREVFETCVWIGRFTELCVAGHRQMRIYYRKDIKMHLCQSMRAKDPHIRQALLDKRGIVGTKKNPGPLYGISGHLWAALAVADYAEAQLYS